MKNTAIVVKPDPVFLIDRTVNFEIELSFPTSDYKKVDSINFNLSYTNRGEEYELEQIRIQKTEIQNSNDIYNGLFTINKNIEEILDTADLQVQSKLYRNGRLINTPKLSIALIINKNER